MKYVCATCGGEFQAPRGNYKYCCAECRAIGARENRKKWEQKNNYNERQRIAIAERRKQCKKRTGHKGKAKKKPDIPKRNPKRFDTGTKVKIIRGKLADELTAARMAGDHKKYWRIYQRYVIDTAESMGHFSPCKVNGISVYHPQFVDLVLDSVEREQRITITNNRG